MKASMRKKYRLSSPPKPVCGYGHKDDGKHEQDKMHDVVLV